MNYRFERPKPSICFETYHARASRAIDLIRILSQNKR